MTNDDIKHYLNHFKEKIEEAVGLVPGMSAEQKLKAVQFWNLVSERLQEIVNNSAADINALAMRMEEEKQTAQKESTNLNAMQNLHESKSVTSNKAEDCTDLRYTCNHLLEPNPTDVMPNYATNCKEEMMDGISNLDLIERNVPNADPDPNPHDKNVPQQSDNNVIRSMEQNTRRNVIQSTSQTSPAKSDTSNLNLTENIDFFSQDAQPQVNGSQPLENAEDFNANNSNNLMRISNENSESSLSADSISFLSNDTSCESSRNLIEEQQVTQSLSETSKPSRSKTESTEAGASDQSSPQSKPYSCVECNSKFSTKGNLLVHQRRHTGEKPFGCEKCPASFSTKGNLKRHIKAHSGERPWECTMCDSKFTEKKSLKVHMRRHTGEKPYKCTICDKSFSQTGVLQTHMALHLDERKHLCEMCGKAFRQRSQLRLHVLRHEGVKRWNCPNCSAKFLTKGDLERHYRVHTGERPFVCDLCGKTFTRQQSLNEHSNRHYGLKPYSCNICNKKFAEMSACYKHIKVHKKMDAQVNMNVDTLGEKPNTSTDEGTNSNQESPSRVNVIKAAPTESSNGMSVFHDLKQLPNPQPQPTFTKEDICASIPDLDLTAINILANASTYQQTF